MRLRALAAVGVTFAAVLAPGGAQAAVPSDPLATTWTYAALNLPAAWDVTTGSDTVVVAIVDSGVQASHPDLLGAIDVGHDFIDGGSDTTDLHGHGTAVAGLAAARANNGLGAAGACWSCRIMPLRVLGREGFALNTTIARAVDYAVERGAAVVNLSLYGGGENRFLRDAVRRARAAGVPVVAAAGNEASTTQQYPAAYPEAISVGATTESGELADYSSRGAWVKLAAPGCSPTTLLGGEYGVGCGTSGAVPLVAGIVGLLRSRYPLATATQIEAALVETATPTATVRFGRVNAFAALLRLGEAQPALEPTIFGSAVPGQTLTAYSGVWSGAQLDVDYRWERCRADNCEAVAAGSRYVVRAEDGGAQLRVVLSAATAQSAISARTDLVPTPPRSLSPPRISGRPAVGGRLTGTPGSWSGGSLGYLYRWARCTDASCRRSTVVGFDRSYRVRASDRGRWLRLTVTAGNAVGRGTASSRPTARIR